MANSGNTNGAVLATIPPGRTWIGEVTLSAATTGAAGDTSMSAHPSVTVSGSGASGWSSGDTVVSLALALPAVSLTALVGSNATASLTSPKVVIKATDNTITLVLNVPSRVTANATAVGVLV